MAKSQVAIPEVMTDDPQVNEAFLLYKLVIYELATKVESLEDRIKQLETP